KKRICQDLRFLQSSPTNSSVFPADPSFIIGTRIIDALSVLATNRLVSFLSKAMSFAPISRGRLAGGQNLRSPFRRGSLSHFATLPFGCTVNKLQDDESLTKSRCCLSNKRSLGKVMLGRVANKVV